MLAVPMPPDRPWRERHVLFREIPDGLRHALPDQFHGFTYRPRGGSLAQLYFDEPLIHFEVAFHWKNGLVELGFHFEKDADTNERLFSEFDRQIVAIKAELGESIDLERWDRGWTRLYECWPCDRVDPPFRAELVKRLGRIIASLQPIYESVKLEPANVGRDAISRIAARP